MPSPESAGLWPGSQAGTGATHVHPLGGQFTVQPYVGALLLPQAQPPVSLLWDIFSSAPSSLMPITYVQLHFLLLTPATPSRSLQSGLEFIAATHTLMHIPTHVRAHTAVECFPASGVYGSGACAPCHLPKYLTSSLFLLRL